MHPDFPFDVSYPEPVSLAPAEVQAERRYRAALEAACEYAKWVERSAATVAAAVEEGQDEAEERVWLAAA